MGIVRFNLDYFCCVFMLFQHKRSHQGSPSLKKSLLAASLIMALPLGSYGQMAWAQSGEASDLESQIFEQVFKDPTNMLLNFKLAGAQLQNGNVKGAIGTLERVLTIDPENNEAQFLIANAHLRLGNNVDARRMLALLLENPKASDVERQQAEAILANLDRQQRRFFITGSVSAGGGIADNPEGGSIGNVALVSGSIGEVTDKSANAEDYLSTAANVNLTAKLESQRDETISIGLATGIPGPDDSPAEFLRQADQALYQAKQNGRNRLEARSVGS